METTTKWMNDETDLQDALHLIKMHITEADTQQNLDLHKAVNILVNVARRNDHLSPSTR